jgi:hypothetical protein
MNSSDLLTTSGSSFSFSSSEIDAESIEDKELESIDLSPSGGGIIIDFSKELAVKEKIITVTFK